MSRLQSRIATILAISMAIACSSNMLAQHCGVERWSVKTGIDADVAHVELANAQDATIAQLIALTPPHPIPPDSRFSPTENTVFVVNATLTDYKMEGGAHGDSDYHLVLKDDQGKTMVAEIPSPACVGNGSPFAAQIANARAQFDTQFSATSSFQTANIPVRVTGVGFFDFPHGQRGAAPNVIELHPVLDIVFNPQLGDFTLAVSPSTMNLAQGGSTSATITTTSSGTSGGNPTFTASGLPAGVNSQITAIAGGKVALSLTASAAAPTGAFPVTIVGTLGGKSRSQTATLNLSPFSSAPGTQQWEYQVITATSEQDVVDQANQLGALEWEMVSAVKVTGTIGWRAFFKRLKRSF